MSTFFRCYKAEFIKRKHTIFYPLHFAIPILFVIGINLLLMSRRQNIDENYYLQLVFQVISIALPLLSSVFCGFLCDNEANAGNYQNVLASPHSRIITITAQLTMLMTMCAFSIVLSITGIIITMPVSFSTLVITGAIIWICEIGVYAVHLFFGYKFGIGICSIIGFLGVIISSLATTGSFDEIWYYIPQSWAIRLATAFLGNIGVMSQLLSIVSLFTTFIIVIVVIWFNLWESKKMQE